MEDSTYSVLQMEERKKIMDYIANDGMDEEGWIGWMDAKALGLKDDRNDVERSWIRF